MMRPDRSVYMKRRKLAIERGTWRSHLVDADPVREHVQGLRDAGMSTRRVSDVSGIPMGTLDRLLYGQPGHGQAPSQQVDHVTAERLLAVVATPETAARRRCVQATGSMRRLQALQLRGWSLARLADLAGVRRPALTLISNGSQVIVTADTAAKIAALCRRLWDQDPPRGTRAEKISATHARAYAMARGYLPLAVWDDIDDPAAKPHLCLRTDVAS